MARSRLLVALALAAQASATAVDISVHGVSADNVESSAGELGAALQGTLLLASALPAQGPKPSLEVESQMTRAGDLGYAAYRSLSLAEQDLGVVSERLEDGTSASADAARMVAEDETAVSKAASQLREGQGMAQKAKAAFLALADPLGDQPVAPKSWDEVTGMLIQAQGRAKALQGRLADVKGIMKRKGVSLISVAQESAVVIQDTYGKQQDDKILDFLAQS